MKKTNKLDNNLKMFLLKIKIKISNFIFRWIKNPIQERKKRRIDAETTKNIIESFHKQFNVHPSVINSLIKRGEKIILGRTPNIVMTHNEYHEFLMKELIESAVLTHTSNKKPLFYDPEIVDIHNETLNDSNKIPMDELKGDYSKIAIQMLTTQEENYK